MATDKENTPQRRIEDKHPAEKIDWGQPEAPAVPLSITAGAAKGGNTSDNASQASSVLTDEQIVQVWQNMPGGPNGWLKEFGYLQFARAIEAEVANAAPAAPVQPSMLVPKWAGYFHSYQDWVNKAQSRLASPEHRRAMCVDAKGRRCAIGKDFMLARDEDAFPVRYFWECELAAPVQADQAQAAEVRAQALHTLNRDGWKIDGSLIYRLSDKGVNCDEINITMVNGSRAAEVRHDSAIELLAELSSTADKASEVRAATLREAANFARCYDLGTPDGHAIADVLESMAAAPSTADSGNTSALGEGVSDAAPVAQQAAAVAAPSENDIQLIIQQAIVKYTRGAEHEAAARAAAKSIMGLYAAPATAVAATTSEDARDAARYRWLREQSYETFSQIAFNTWNNDPFVFPYRDQFIDAAMRATQQEGGK